MIDCNKRRVVFGLDRNERIEALKEFLDLEELLFEIGLKNVYTQGSEIWASCPFHNDRKRHWSINADLDGERWGLHSCFVCRESGVGSGNVVTLVRDLLQLQYYDDALQWLEKFARLELSEEEILDLVVKKRLKRKGRLSNRNSEEDPSELYHNMNPLNVGSAGWSYLISRGVSPEQISERGIRMGKVRYRERVVIPIYLGLSVVNFYARSFTDREPKGLYARKKGTISTTLWGLGKANKLLDKCYLTEGIFDALTGERLLQAADIIESSNVFATGGPIIHEAQARLLDPFETIIVIPDMKGKAKSLVPTAKKYLKKQELFIVEPPSGMDLDDWGRANFDEASSAMANPRKLYDTEVTTRVNYTVRY